MYLTKSLSWNNQHRDMVGAIPADTIMHEKPKGRGYVKLVESKQHPWPNLNEEKPNGDKPQEIAAHEFHYSSLSLTNKVNYAYDVTRGTGIDGKHDGIVYKNVLGCYAHLRDVENNHWVQRFIEFVRQCKKIRNVIN